MITFSTWLQCFLCGIRDIQVHGHVINVRLGIIAIYDFCRHNTHAILGHVCGHGGSADRYSRLIQEGAQWTPKMPSFSPFVYLRLCTLDTVRHYFSITPESPASKLLPLEGLGVQITRQGLAVMALAFLASRVAGTGQVRCFVPSTIITCLCLEDSANKSKNYSYRKVFFEFKNTSAFSMHVGASQTQSMSCQCCYCIQTSPITRLQWNRNSPP